MILKPHIVELLKKNNKIRYGLVTLLTLMLIGVIAYDRLSLSERIPAEKTFDCPSLDQGCQVEVRNLPYQVKTDVPIAPGKPFVLYVDGGGVEMHAAWRAKGVGVEPNYYRMESLGSDRWKASMTLPASPQIPNDWVLHLEINARAVDINILAP